MAAGCKIESPSLNGKPPDWLQDSLVVDFAAERACRLWPELHKRGCKLLHLPCHCFVMPHEDATFKICPPTAIVCQSNTQRCALLPHYTTYGVSDLHLIRPAFDRSFFPYAPYQRGNETFVVGAIGRDDVAKWPPRIVRTLTAAKHRGLRIRGRFLGWTPSMESNSGKLPDWIRHYPPGSMSANAFLAGCHALLCFSDYIENWPRVVLEAMSSGVPVIADGRGGYLEQIRHGETGILAANEATAIECMLELASDERLRLELAECAKDNLKTLASPTSISAAWLDLFAALS